LTPPLSLSPGHTATPEPNCLSEGKVATVGRALRTNEDAYRQYVAGRNLSDDLLVRVMADHPELIQRPIVTRGDKAVLARPVERLAELGIAFESER
jgi:arsenate reductase-like glutaredoxin family protein